MTTSTHTSTARPEATDAVLAWWRAMQTQDREALEHLVCGDYLASGGPSGRTTGRAALLSQADEFFAAATIDGWVDDLEVREHGDVAVCAYRWSEHGSHHGQPFA